MFDGSQPGRMVFGLRSRCVWADIGGLGHRWLVGAARWESTAVGEVRTLVEQGRSRCGAGELGSLVIGRGKLDVFG